MGDGGILSSLGYRNMWPKLKDMRSDGGAHSNMKSLQFCCEKRVSLSKKVWIGKFCSMAMAAYAHDLIVEALSWADTPLHYPRSEVLIRKAQELREVLGENNALEDRGSRKKVVDFAHDYANMYPCCDSKQSLKECFASWVRHKGEGPLCTIRIEKPPVRDEADRDRYFPPTLLPPMYIPVSLKPQESPRQRELPSCRTLHPGPFNCLGISQLRQEMDVEPDCLSRSVINDMGAVENTRTIPCIYQQWTWCTRPKVETSQRRWHASRHLPLLSPKTTFEEAPRFSISGCPPVRFTMLNFRVYDYLNLKKTSSAKPSKEPDHWRGTAMLEYVEEEGSGNHDSGDDVDADTPMNDVQ